MQDKPITREHKIARIAAGLGISNCGCGNHINDRMTISPWTGVAGYDAVSLATPLIENEAMEEMFFKEAESWHSIIGGLKDEELISQYKHQPWVSEVLLFEPEPK